MRPKLELQVGVTMEEIMRTWPETIPILLRNRMHCVGCMLTPFHDLREAAHEHELNEAELLKQLRNS